MGARGTVERWNTRKLADLIRRHKEDVARWSRKERPVSPDPPQPLQRSQSAEFWPSSRRTVAEILADYHRRPVSRTTRRVLEYTGSAIDDRVPDASDEPAEAKALCEVTDAMQTASPDSGDAA